MEFLKLEAGDVAPDKILLDLGFDSIGLTTFANAVNEKFNWTSRRSSSSTIRPSARSPRTSAEERKDDLLRFYRPRQHRPAGAPRQRRRRQAQRRRGRAAAGAVLRERQGLESAGRRSGRLRTARRRAPAEASPPELRFVQEPIAIVGMSGVMPQSEDLDEFWENLKDSKDLVTRHPARPLATGRTTTAIR